MQPDLRQEAMVTKVIRQGLSAESWGTQRAITAPLSGSAKGSVFCRSRYPYLTCSKVHHRSVSCASPIAHRVYSHPLSSKYQIQSLSMRSFFCALAVPLLSSFGSLHPLPTLQVELPLKSCAGAPATFGSPSLSCFFVIRFWDSSHGS